MTKYKKDKYKVLVLGGGGRSNALLRSLSESPMLDSLYTTNKHKEFLKHANYLDVDCSNFPRLACACKENQIDIVIPSQEKFLAQGISDALTAEGIEVFGPNKNSSKLESFKSYAKDFCDANDIPTAKHWQFSDKNLACQFLEGNQVFPIVIKADGLASGKGVIICQNIDEAKDAIEVVFSGKLDGKGDVVIIEEFLKGKEVGFFVLLDGKNLKYFGAARDYKSVSYDGKNYNTGGMGSFTPVPDIDIKAEQAIMRNIIYPTINGMYNASIQFKGILFAGVMFAEDGPKLLEYNVRFGDPETQSLLMRIKSDFLELIVATVEQKLGPDSSVEFNNNHVVCLVMATNGYPIQYKKGSIIKIPDLSMHPDVHILHAGSDFDSSGNLIAVSGRVLNIVATASSLSEAREKAFLVANKIDWPEGFLLDEIAAV